ncbi:tail Collar domain-containing protein [Flavobacterium suaedae]|uniref:Tail Collar domain-containing protein n=1 Tax=Flavobacterium suaedae TaxID=1767027 RepID=A0ABQ1JXY2_9FLAO|nr:tail fiber protein [Flavobacterium suaedae]GGB81613.1 tail Collar domain-containing protein [Flavobacterium suaedae]
MEEYLGTIKSFAFNFAPVGWKLCDGELLSISANQALFSLLGTTYGGDGQTTFGLPDLRGRTIVHPGYGPGLDPVTWGEKYGMQKVTLTNATMPYHAHLIVSGNGDQMVSVATETKVHVGTGSVINETDYGTYPFGAGGSTPNIYAEADAGTDRVGGIYSQSIVNGTTKPVGGGEQVDIKQPFLGVYMCIAVEGIYPSRN